jgi:hypothetical protein
MTRTYRECEAPAEPHPSSALRPYHLSLPPSQASERSALPLALVGGRSVGFTAPAVECPPPQSLCTARASIPLIGCARLRVPIAHIALADPPKMSSWRLLLAAKGVTFDDILSPSTDSMQLFTPSILAFDDILFALPRLQTLGSRPEHGTNDVNREFGNRPRVRLPPSRHLRSPRPTSNQGDDPTAFFPSPQSGRHRKGSRHAPRAARLRSFPAANRSDIIKPGARAQDVRGFSRVVRNGTKWYSRA